jgi:hypothetical protein
MAQAVHTRNKRFSFIEKTSGEVGAGTDYPILVTLDQIAEIYHRVKDASFISGSWTQSDFGDDFELKVTSISKPSELVSMITGGTYGAYSARGFCAITNDVTPDKPLPTTPEPLFGAAYYFSNAYDVAVRDIGDYERGMWECGFDPKTNDKVGFYWEAQPSLGGASVFHADSLPSYRNGFSQTFSSDESTNSYTLYGIFGDLNGVEIPSEASININGEVAFVDTTGSGNPFDSWNSLYLPVYFAGWVGFGGGGAIFLSSTNDNALVGSMVSSGINLVMRLSGDVDISCPLYYDDGFYTARGTIGGSDFIIKADEWWSYQDSGGNVWSPTTGAKL